MNDKKFAIWILILALLSVFLFVGNPDIHDRLIQRLDEKCIVEEVRLM